MPSGDTSFVKGYFFTTPAPFAECHASTILHLQNGEFMGAWFGGQKEGTDDVGIWLVKGKPGNWTMPVEVAKIREDAHWNPVLFQAPEGRVFLYFKVGKKIPSWETWVKTSDDNGQTWSEVTLTDLPNPNSGTDAVTLKDGRHLLVYNHTPKGRSPLNVALSDDGKTWKLVATLESEPGEYSYPAVIQTKDGQIHITYTWKRQKVRHVALDPDKL